MMNKLESCWPANGTVLLLLLQWLQDAPAYRDMQGGGAGLSAPACLLCPADDSSPRRGPLQLGGLLDLDWSECMLCTVCRVWPSGLSDCLTSQRRHPLIRPSQAPSPETSRLSARLMFDQPTEPHVSVISISSTATAQIVTLPVVYLPRVLLNSRRAGTGRGCSRDPPPPCPLTLAPLHLSIASPPPRQCQPGSHTCAGGCKDGIGHRLSSFASRGSGSPSPASLTRRSAQRGCF